MNVQSTVSEMATVWGGIGSLFCNRFNQDQSNTSCQDNADTLSKDMLLLYSSVDIWYLSYCTLNIPNIEWSFIDLLYPIRIFILYLIFILYIYSLVIYHITINTDISLLSQELFKCLYLTGLDILEKNCGGPSKLNVLIHWLKNAIFSIY